MRLQTKYTRWMFGLSVILATANMTEINAGTITEYSSIPGVQTDTGSTAKTQFIFISKSDAMTTGINFKSTATPINGTVTGYHWAFTGGTPLTSDVQNPGTVKFTSMNYGDSNLCTVGVTHLGSHGETCAVKTNPISKINVVVPKIIADSGQAGTNGDMVASIITTGAQEFHYVSPQATSSDYVTLVASAPGVTASNFGLLLEWDTSVGSSVSGSPNKWKVSRGTAGKFTVKLKRVNDHTEVARINVWIVWVTIATTASGSTVTDDGTYTRASSSVSWTATVQPSGIYDTSADIPNLEGAPGSTEHVPYYNTNTVVDGLPYGQPDYKWDLARSMRVHIKSPNEGTAAYGTNNGIFNSLPSASLYQTCSPDQNGTTHYPTNALEGNDTSLNSTKSCDIYTFPLGQMTDMDGPALPVIKDSSGSAGDTVYFNTQWLEFARLDINGVWYVVSNKMPNRLNAAYKKSGTGWIDNGTVSDATNSNF